MAMNLVKLPTGKSNLQLRVSKGHYATSHSHINYYIDVTLTKFRLSEHALPPPSWCESTSRRPLWTRSSAWTHRGHRRLHGQ